MPHFKNGYHFKVDGGINICLNCAKVHYSDPSDCCEFYENFNTGYSWEFIQKYLDLDDDKGIDHPDGLFFNMIPVILNKIFSTYSEFERTSDLGKKILILTIQDLMNKNYIECDGIVDDMKIEFDKKIVKVNDYLQFIDLIVNDEIQLESPDDFLEAFVYSVV